MKSPTRVLLISPAYNEENTLPSFFSAVEELARSQDGRAEFRILIVNDGSTDGTQAILERFAATKPETIGYVRFAANFGHQAALIAGLMHVDDWSDVAITLDCDLEHPLSVIPQMLDRWESERPVLVNTVRRRNRRLSWHKRLFSWLFYRTTTKLTGIRILPGQADYRLWDSRVLQSVSPFLKHAGSIRVFSAWLPGRKIFIEYDQATQDGRTSRFSFKQNLEIWKIGIFRFSKLPFSVITALGALGLTFSLVYGTYILYAFAQGKTIAGWTSLALTIVFMGCIQLVSIGLVANYLNRLVFAKDLPTFIVQERSPLFFSSKS